MGQVEWNSGRASPCFDRARGSAAWRQEFRIGHSEELDCAFSLSRQPGATAGRAYAEPCSDFKVECGAI